MFPINFPEDMGMDDKVVSLHTKLNELINSSNILSEKIKFETFSDFQAHAKKVINKNDNTFKNELNYLIISAAFADQFNSEEQALLLLNDALELIEDDKQTLEIVRYLKAILFRNLAVNFVNRSNQDISLIAYLTFFPNHATNYENNFSNYSIALCSYFEAIKMFIELELNYLALETLEQVKDLSDITDPQIQETIFAGLLYTSIPLQRALSTKGWTLIKEICDICILQISLDKDFLNLSLLFAFAQLAKGHLFSHSIEISTPEIYNILQDWERIHEKSPQLTRDDLIPSNKMDESVDILSFMQFNEYEKTEGNFFSKKDFDAYINSLLYRYTILASQESFFPRNNVLQIIDDLKSEIEENSLLIYIYNGISKDKKDTVYTIFITKSISFLEINSLEKPLRESIDICMNSIQKEPGRKGFFGRKRVVNFQSDKELSSFSKLLWNDSLENILNNKEINKCTHLCFIPHGVLHYFPFHLIMESGQPLCSKYKITYLPNLHLFNQKKHNSPFPKSESVYAAGVDFEDSKLFISLPEVINEVKAIAEAFNTKPHINEEVSANNIFTEMRSYKYIHLASHGKMDFDCPVFHRIYLHSKGEEINCLYAYQLISIDMRNVELLTLSACETSLMRFDSADNLRGLPSFFFLAGVSTIIATMWEVESNTSEYFFKTLYSSIKKGTSKLVAFAEAQNATRLYFPDFRDWGAFCFIGKYNEKNLFDNITTIPGIPYIQFSG